MKFFLLPVFLICCLSGRCQFVETSNVFGISLYNDNPLFGNATCFVDFDDDGWDDLTLAAKNQVTRFYKNNSGTLVPYVPSFTPALPTNIDVKCVLWVDYDNDGDKDFIMSGLWTFLRVYRNDGNMTFVEVSAQIGFVPEEVQIYGVSAGDYNNDGWLDLFVCKYHNSDFFDGYEYANHLYKNEGNGTFSDITMSSQIGEHIQASFCCVWLDYDMDGWQDIYVVNDRFAYPNYMYKNNGNGTFTDVTASCGAGIYIEAMSSTCDDYDNDGDMDIYVTNSPGGNFLMNYDSQTQFFTNVAPYAGVEVFEICWAGLWLDYDNDTWQDLFVGNIGQVGSIASQNTFYHNDGDGTFTDVTGTIGILGDGGATFTAAMGDYNHDGYYDYATNCGMPTNASVWLNDGGSNNWLSLTVEGTISNSDGIGTWIECYAGGNKYIRYTFCGENYMGQNSEREIFGLGNHTVVDSLKFKWLSGIEETYYNITANANYHYIEGQSFSNEIVNIESSGDLVFCEGDSVMLTGPAAQEYLWSTGDTTQTITVYSQGIYSLMIINEYGLEQNSETVVVSYLPEPVPVTDISNCTCYDFDNGQISVSLVADEISDILWNTSDTTTTITDLSPGIYSFALTGALGCSGFGNVEITEPDSLNVEVITTDNICHGNTEGTADPVISGGTPGYQIDWNGVDPEALAAGTYEVTVMDSMSCTKNTSFIITSPDSIVINIVTTPQLENISLGSASLDISGGTEPYSIVWSTLAEDVTELSDLFAGFYSVNITDGNGCTATESFMIEFVVHVASLYGQSEIICYPVPSHDLVTVVLPAGSNTSLLEVSGRAGRKVYSKEIAGENKITIDISSWAPGFYLVTLLNNGKRIAAGQLIRQ